MFIYDFPQMRPGVWICNSTCLYEGKLIIKMINNIGIGKVLIHPTIADYKASFFRLKKRKGLEVIQMTPDMIITPKSLLVYNINNVKSVEDFEKDFNCILSKYGEIIIKEAEMDPV